MPIDYQPDLPALSLTSATDAVRTVLEKAKAQVGFVPNMYAHMANAPELLNSYLDGYGHFRTKAGFTAVEQEVVFLTISRENACEYCVSAHSFVADAMSQVPRSVTDAIRDGHAVPDARLAALSRFVSAMVIRRGRPTPDEAAQFLAAGYTDLHILWLVLAIAVKTISNYSNHLARPELDPVFTSRAWHN